MYLKKAVIFHQPRVYIVESSRPAFAAVVAAPIRKLCPQSAGKAAQRASLTFATKYGLVNGIPLLRVKKGPSMYNCNWAEEIVCATYENIDSSSQLVTFRCTFKVIRDILLSVAISTQDRCCDESKAG